MDGEKNSDTILHHCHLQHHIFINNNHHIQPQINKFQKFVEYVHVDLSLNKWALTGHPDDSNLKSITCKAYLQSNHITYKQHPFLALTSRIHGKKNRNRFPTAVLLTTLICSQ
jgi:hypothetical protein